jgi:hypothetical protein
MALAGLMPRNATVRKGHQLIESDTKAQNVGFSATFLIQQVYSVFNGKS